MALPHLISGTSTALFALPSLTFTRVALRESLRDAIGARYPLRAPTDHLKAAMDWLAQAQDQTGNGGVSAGFGRQGWLPDYPETTGYIIPTCLEYYHLSGDAAFLDRAQRMGDYEVTVQTEEGAIPGGFGGAGVPRIPCVFDTGQVIFGWVALYLETGNPKYLASAQLAGDWLLSVQADDGSWPTHDHAPSARAYHARVSWALVLLGQVTSQRRYADAASRQITWTIANQRPNGWFAHAELRGDAFPVTHTIAYTIRGVLETGVCLGEDRFVASARLASDALLGTQLPDGSLDGRYDPDWKPVARWCCLTGCAQMSLNWLHLHELTGDNRYCLAAQRSNTFLRQTQNLDAKDPSRGAIRGSMPFHGAYERFKYPNWATKFFADALMLESHLDGRARPNRPIQYHG